MFDYIKNPPPASWLALEGERVLAEAASHQFMLAAQLRNRITMLTDSIDDRRSVVHAIGDLCQQTGIISPMLDSTSRYPDAYTDAEHTRALNRVLSDIGLEAAS